MSKPDISILRLHFREPYASQMIDNFRKHGGHLGCKEERIVELCQYGNYTDTLNYCFTWDNSPEGQNYWNKVNELITINTDSIIISAEERNLPSVPKKDELNQLIKELRGELNESD